jgi:hypothetical protein
MIEVFKTNVEHRITADQIQSALQVQFPSSRINFDLEDCDRILRVEDHEICIQTIIEWMSNSGFQCEVLN